MGRSSKFAFPLPGRRSHGERDADSGRHPAPELDHDYDYDYPQPTKAERLLGTGLPGRRTGSGNNSAAPSLQTKKSYMSITLSEASQESSSRRKGSPATDDAHLVPPNPRFRQDSVASRGKDRSGSVSSRKLNSQGSSSTLRSHYDAKRQPLHVSQQTSATAIRDGGLRKGSSATTHSSARSIDQTSLASSIRSRSEDRDAASIGRSSAGGKKKKVPARLDLSKLFPKAPKAKEENDSHLLSPTKFVSSPIPMSTTSAFFPRPQSSPTTTNSNRNRAPSVTSTKTSDTLREGRAQAAKDRAYNNSDNAKVNRRRPPPGIQHWFEGLSEEDDDEEGEDEVDERAIVRANMKIQDPRPLPLRQPQQPSQDHRRPASPPRHARKVPPSKASAPVERTYPREAKPKPQTHPYRMDQHYQNGVNTRSSDKPHLRGQPSQASLASHASTRTKASKISNSNLKGDSVLSLSSSEDEADPRSSGSELPIIRDSLAVSTDNEGEILIGKAQAFDIRPRYDRNGRRMTAASNMTAASGNSMRSTTTAATIDVMISPTTAASSQTNLLLPRYSRMSRVSSRHSRQVSDIPEDDHSQSQRNRSGSIGNSSYDGDDSRSVMSGRTSKSEPRFNMGHKLMAVTEEEEVLLELMRRKRAAMAKQSFTEGYKSAIKAENARTSPTYPPEGHERTSGFLNMESPVSEHGRHSNERDRRPSQKSALSHITAAGTEISSASAGETLVNAVYVPPPPRSEKRNRQPPIANEAILRSPEAILRSPETILRSPGAYSQASTTSIMSSPRSRATARVTSQPPQISPAIFSPLEVFASPPDSPTFPATASHTDTIPSPVTPGPGSEGDVIVKVAGSSIGGSEASFDFDFNSLHQSHHHHNSSDTGMNHKGKERMRDMEMSSRKERERQRDRELKSQTPDRARSHSRRRTASSGANVDVCPEKPAKEKAVALTTLAADAVPPRTSSHAAFPKPPAAPIRQNTTTSMSSVATTKGRARPAHNEYDWDAEVDVGAVINQVRKSRSSQMIRSSRTSTSSTATNLPNGVPPVPRVSRQSSVASHISSASGARSTAGDTNSKAGDKLSVTPLSSAAATARNSVCEDVLAAWGSLGGSRGETYF